MTGDGVTAVILAGGAGTRLWPLSRSAMPKHLLGLLPDPDGGPARTLLRATYERAALLADRVLVVTEASQLEAARSNLPELAEGDWLVEPGRRGTAACLGLAAAMLPPQGVMLSLHADHLIPDTPDFPNAARSALAWAAEGEALVTLGLRPRHAATGFGYIEAGAELAHPGRLAARRAVAFVEKPPADEARRMVASGDHLWNTGIFAWRNSLFLAELEEHAPDIKAGAVDAARRLRAGDIEGYRATYLEIPEMAVDHAVMERTARLVVVPADFAWSDVGNWADLRDAIPTDEAGNAVLGDVLAIDSSQNVVRGDGRLVALLGVSGMVVIATPDAILVCPVERAQDVKQVVGELRSRGREELL